LGIKLPEETINAVKELKPNLATLYPKEPSKKYAIKILYSELRANEITIYLKENTIDKSLKVVCVSRISEITEQIECLIDGNSIKVLCAKPDELFKIYLINNEGLQISNFNIIHRLDSLIKSNPDPQQEKLDYLFEQDYPDGEGITELLQYADFSWADEESNNKISTSGSSDISHSKISDAPKVYEKLNAKDFNTVSNDVFLKQTGELSNSSVKIVDFLRIVSSDGSFTTTNDFKESAEQSLLEDTEQNGQGENIEHSIKAKIAAEKEQRAIINYFKKLHDQYKEKLKNFYELKTLKDTPKEEITIKTLSNVLIGLQLIQLFQGKKYTIENSNELNQEKTLVEKTYLKDGELNSEFDSIKGFLFEVFGKFLLLSTGSMKTYDYEILIQKLNHNRKETFVKSLFIMMNLNWKEREMVYRDSLILNSLYFINPTDPTDLDFLKNLQESIFKLKSEAKFVSNSFSSNWEYFCDSIFPKYSIWYKSFNDATSKKSLITDVKSLNSNSIIFSRYIGFNNVHKLNSTSNGNYSLDLKREGYEWNDDMKKHLATSIDFPLKCIIY
jgi:hypothetical protein